MRPCVGPHRPHARLSLVNRWSRGLKRGFDEMSALRAGGRGWTRDRGLGARGRRGPLDVVFDLTGLCPPPTLGALPLCGCVAAASLLFASPPAHAATGHSFL